MSNSVGLVQHTTYYAPSSGTNFMRGLVPVKVEHSAGRTGTKYFDREWVYLDTGDNWYKAVGGVTIGNPIVKESREYHAEGSTGTSSNYNITTYAHTFWSSTSWLIKKVETSEPTVTTGTNGSNAATTTERYTYENGLTGFTRDQGGHFTYFEYDSLTGQLTRRVDDVDDDDTAAATAATALGATLPTTGGLRLETSYTYDRQGRVMSSKMPHARITARHYTKLADNREVQLSFPLYAVVSSVPTWYGPMSYRVLNHAGQAESTMTLTLDGSGNTSTDPAAIIDEAESDAMTAVDTGEATIAHLATATYDEAGSRMLGSRVYFTLPADLTPTPTTGYDETLFGYDSRGRQTRVEDPDGTIHRTDFDVLSRVTARWVGTNDSGSPNMTEFERREYDGGNEGNGHLTKVTLDPNGVWTGSPPPPTTADQRVTEFAYTYRGFNTLVKGPLPPFTVTAYDNLGRPTASAGYSSASGLTAASAPSSPTNRVSLDETFYDARGQVWKTITHKIDYLEGAGDGSDDDSLTTLHWFDAEGRGIKSVGPGGLNKTQYDVVGRVTHEFTLASTNDSGYGDADDVSGDLVLEERQTY
ncbi:MAG: hypothetical protein PSX37_13730, partial [bacterium]|nr:hypothetical protein [bacterium]